MSAESKTSVKIEVFVNRRKLEVHTAEVTGAELVQLAGFEGQDWDLFQLQGEGDPTGGRPVPPAEILHLKNGEHFRVIPGNRSFGA